MSAEISPTTTKRRKPAKQNSRVTNYVDQQLEKTRRQVKSTDLIAAGLKLLVLVIGFLLIAAIADAWLVTFTPLLRWTAFIFLLGSSAALVVFSIWPLLTKKINPDYAAKMLEESKPGFSNSLLNYVWFRKKPQVIQTAVFDAVAREAAVNLNAVPADSTVDRSKVINLGFWLVGLTAAFIFYFMLSPKNPFQTVARVLFPGSDISKPAVVVISDVSHGDGRIFFGDQVQVTAKITGPHVPEDVQFIYSTLDGRQVNQLLTMVPDPSTPDQYKLDLFKQSGGIRESLAYYIVARDGRSLDFQIDVSARPAIAVESIQLTPPKYTRLPVQTLTGSEIEGVEGTRVKVNALANLPIDNATLELLRAIPTVAGEPRRYSKIRAPLKMKVDGKTASTNFQLTLDANREKPMATHYRLNFESIDGDQPEDSNVYGIEIDPDRAPEVEILSPTDKSSKVPVNGSLSVLIQAHDLDYEISSIELQTERGGNKLATFISPLQLDETNRQKAKVQYRIQPSKLGLKVGDKIVFYAIAADNRTSYSNDLELDPNLTRTDLYDLEVVEATKEDPSQKSKNDQESPPEKGPDDAQNKDSQEQGNSSDSDGGEQTDSKDKGDSKNSDTDSQDENQGDDQRDSDDGEQGSDSKDNGSGDDKAADSGEEKESKDGDQGGSKAGGSEGTDQKQSEGGAGSDSTGQDSQQSEAGKGGDGSQDQQESTEGDSQGQRSGGNDSSAGSSESQDPGASGQKSDDPAAGGGEGEAMSDEAGGNGGQGQAAQDGNGNRESGSPDASSTERRDKDLTEGEEQLSEDASDAEKIRKLQELLGDKPNKDQADGEQNEPAENKDDQGSDQEKGGSTDAPNQGDGQSGQEDKQGGQEGKQGGQEGKQGGQEGKQGGQGEGKQGGQGEGGQGGQGEGKQGGQGKGKQGGGSEGQGKKAGGASGGDGDAGDGVLQREKENLENSKKATDLILQQLEGQRDDPDPELLKKMNWSKDDLNNFLDRWKQMRDAAKQGDVKAKNKYDRAVKSLGLRPDGARRKVTNNGQEAGSVNQDGAINAPPADQLHDFNAFLRDLNRARN